MKEGGKGRRVKKEEKKEENSMANCLQIGNICKMFCKVGTVIPQIPVFALLCNVTLKFLPSGSRVYFSIP